MNSYKKIGFLASIVVLITFAVYVFFQRDAIFAMKPNEFGDFLAGVAGTLAFLWLVLGFFQQSEELRNSVDALQLQSEELRASVEQQKQLVGVTRQQLQAEYEINKKREEKERKASNPVIVLESGGGSSHSGRASSTINIANHGATCSDIVVVCKWQESSTKTKLGSLERGKAGPVSIQYTYRKKPLRVSVTAEYLRIDGDREKVEFVLESDDPVRFGWERVLAVQSK